MNDTKKPGATPIMPSEIRANAKIVCSSGEEVGSVDHMQGARTIKVKKNDKGTHHYIPLAWVMRVDDEVHLDRTREQATREWSSDPPRS